MKMYGIDFGTTNSSIAMLKFNSLAGTDIPYVFKVEPNSNPDTLLKSLVHIGQDGLVTVGRDAANFAAGSSGGHLFRSIKSELGTEAKYLVAGKIIYPSDVVASVLQTLAHRAKRNTSTKAKGVVLGVPVGFTDKQKEGLLEAVIKSGIVANTEEAHQSVIFVAEPVAVALSYGIELESRERVFVFDFGGGTLDCTIMDMKGISKASLNPSEVLSKYGVSLGGDVIDKQILTKLIIPKYDEDMLKTVFQVKSIDQLTTTFDGYRLMEEIERSKIELSSTKITRFRYYCRSLEMEFDLLRSDLGPILKPICANIKQAVERTLAMANRGTGLSPKDVNVVLMAGGSSLIPAVQDCIRGIFGRTKVRVHDNPMTSIAQGLAIVGGLFSQKKLHIDITDFDYGLWDAKAKEVATIIPAGTRYEDTVYDPKTNRGYFEVFSLINPQSKILKVHIYSKKGDQSKELHTIEIPITRGPAEDRFKVFFEIDSLKGWINVRVYDQYEGEWITPETGSQVRFAWS